MIRISVLPLLVATGCIPIRSGIDVPVTITGQLAYNECGAMSPSESNGTSCYDTNPVFQVQGPLGDFGYMETLINSESMLAAVTYVPYVWLRDVQVDCNGDPRDVPPPEPGDTMTTSLRITAVREDGTRIDDVVWDSWLDGGNPAKQAVSYSVQESGDLCVVVSSIRYSLGDEANHGVGFPPE